jgi:hypothetical protein
MYLSRVRASIRACIEQRLRTWEVI